MPLSAKGQKIMAAMQKQYGEKEGKSVFYASKNAGKINGVDSQDEQMQKIMDGLMSQVAGSPPRLKAVKDWARQRTRDRILRLLHRDEEKTNRGAASPGDPPSKPPGAQSANKPVPKPLSGDTTAATAPQKNKQQLDARKFFMGSIKDALKKGVPVRDALATAVSMHRRARPIVGVKR